jgi:hypothetical protein
MIKAVGRTGDGTPLLILGLSAENVKRLMNDKPITFNLSEVGLESMQVAIIGGPTEQFIMEQLIAHDLLRR